MHPEPLQAKDSHIVQCSSCYEATKYFVAGITLYVGQAIIYSLNRAHVFSLKRLVFIDHCRLRKSEILYTGYSMPVSGYLT